MPILGALPQDKLRSADQGARHPGKFGASRKAGLSLAQPEAAGFLIWGFQVGSAPAKKKLARPSTIIRRSRAGAGRLAGQFLGSEGSCFWVEFRDSERSNSSHGVCRKWAIAHKIMISPFRQRMSKVKEHGKGPPRKLVVLPADMTPCSLWCLKARMGQVPIELVHLHVT